MTQARGKTRILFVDDQRDLTEALQDYFILRGFDARVAASGRDMRQEVTVWHPHVVVLDINLGRGEDGFSLAAWLGSAFEPSERPALLFLSGRAGSVETVLGLELGADDFVQKPVAPRELLARVNRLLERRGHKVSGRGFVRIGKVGIDFDRQTLIGLDGREEPLAPGEYALLKCFLDEPSRIFTRDELLDRAPASDDDVADRAIDRRIGRLRRKLEADGETVIEAIRGQGYRLAESVLSND